MEDIVNQYKEEGFYLAKSVFSQEFCFHEGTGDNSQTINKLKSNALAFKSGDAETGTPVSIPGDPRGMWIRLSVGPNVHNLIEEII